MPIRIHHIVLIFSAFLMWMSFSMDSTAQILTGQSSFYRQLDVVQIRINADVTYQFQNLNFQLFNRNSSRYFLFNEQPQNVQKEHDAALALRYSLSDKMAITGNAKTFTFTNTGLRQDQGLIGLAYRLKDIGSINPSVGFMSDQRSDRLDNGFSWALKTELDPLTFGDTRFDPMVSAEVSYIDPRRFITTRFGSKAMYSYEDLLNMRSEVWFGNSRRDSYQATSLLNRTENNFMESIDTDTTFASMSLDFPIARNFKASVDISGLNNVRKILNSPLEEDPDAVLFDSRSLRQLIDLTTTIRYPNRRFNMNAGFTWSAQVRESRLINTDGLPQDQVRRRTDILENSNFTQSRFELFTNNQIKITPSYSFGLDLSTSILRYDTPEINKDNRDEFAFLFRIRNNIKFSDEFSSSIVLAGEAFHYVYIYAERSIENNWRRSLRLIPDLTWQPNEYFLWRQSIIVRANYTVEDYELPGRPKTDQSARELSFLSELEYEFAPDWSFQMDASRSELRIGKLYWETFQETPIDTLVTYDFQGVVVKKFGEFSISTGIRYFRKFDFLQRATVQLETEQNGSMTRITRIGTGQQITTQIGPVVTISLPFYSKNELFITGWYQVQRTWQKLYIDYPEELRAEFLRAEKQTNRRNFPNLEMVARFHF